VRPALSAGTGQAGASDVSQGSWRFGDARLLDALEGASLAEVDGLGFGLIVMDRGATVVGYNAFESQLSGLRPR
jgi:hypothetical protein